MAQKRLLPLLASIVAITPLAVDMYLPAMLSIAQQLNTDIEMIQISLSIYLAAYAIGMMIFGPLADQYPRRDLARFGLLGFATFSCLIALSNNIELFWLFRAGQAFCGAAATVVVPGIVRFLYQENTAKGMSYVSMIMMVAPLLAPTIGALLLVKFEWNAIFWVLSLYACFAAYWVHQKLINIPRKPNSSQGVALFIDNYKQIWQEKRARLDIATSMLVSFAFFCFLTSVPYVYLDYFSVSESWFGVLFAGNVVALTVGNIINTRIVSNFGSRKMLRYAITIGLCNSVILVFVSAFELGLYPTVVAIGLVMMTIGVIAANADALILIAFEHRSGTATAVIGTLRFGSGALVGPLLAMIKPTSTLAFSCLMSIALLFTFMCQQKQKASLEK
ncbi:Multidrug resistance transporter, Bcr/CflA family [Pseudoalteromonas luteoviolacea B = ATCC 29581]|nr:Multidrug resistance transporter, Bcr/CflA family [Pseudoalteromonas luteoviolacea B = ATCC 29581]